MRRIIKCIKCGSSFIAPRKDAQYCDPCKVIRANERRKKYDKTAKSKAKYAKYRNSDKYREYSRNRYHSLDENKRKARYSVINAIRDGLLIRSKYCQRCGIKDWGSIRSMIEANHYLGYDPKNWLKIEWLCTKCHKQADGFVKYV